MSNGKHITLTLTESCNLKCVYCYEQYKSVKTMALETAKAILDHELVNCADYDYVEIAFHGGEPLLEFDLMRAICEWTWSKDYNCNYYFFATTNGTVLSEEAKEWFRQKKNKIMLGLSLDGNRDVQNHNRSDSYDLIDFEFFKKLWPLQPVKMTISDYTVPKLAESVIHIHELGFKVSANFAFGINWKDTNLDLLDDNLERLVNYYSENPEIEPCSLINQKFELIGSAARRWCGAGTSMRVYDTDGNVFPCHYFMGLTLGDERAESALSLDFSDDTSFRSLECEGCDIYPVCPTCYGYNYASTGNVSIRDKGLCTLTKHCVAAGSMLAYKRLARYSNEDLKIDEDTRAAIINGIVVSQEFLKDKI